MHQVARHRPVNEVKHQRATARTARPGRPDIPRSSSSSRPSSGMERSRITIAARAWGGPTRSCRRRASRPSDHASSVPPAPSHTEGCGRRSPRARQAVRAAAARSGGRAWSFAAAVAAAAAATCASAAAARARARRQLGVCRIHSFKLAAGETCRRPSQGCACGSARPAVAGEGGYGGVLTNEIT